ncbi:MAG: thermonuclease family protein [Pseudorhodobacter sp.]|nr:thermonuclease family protein [Pseudorhodobacter sp.]MDN5788322.1 thermonuclease family protein [Pseudorhodobacter sp.]
MEVAFVLFLLIVFLYVLSTLRTDSKSTRSDRRVRLERVTAKRQPFDAKSARSSPTNPVLHGSAYVVDGDTLVILKTQIRLFGVDAPEMNHPYGRNAKWALVSLCKGEKVKAEVIAEDAHGRAVARCYLQDGRDLSAEMVKLGLAIDWPKFSGGVYSPLEMPGIRKKLWLADARQKGRMHVWEQFEAGQNARAAKE